MCMLIHSNLIGASRLTSNLKTGTIQLPLANFRELSAGNIINTAGDAGVLSVNTTPGLSIVTGGHRLTWVATNVDTIACQIVAPVDFDVEVIPFCCFDVPVLVPDFDLISLLSPVIAFVNFADLIAHDATDGGNNVDERES